MTTLHFDTSLQDDAQDSCHRSFYSILKRLVGCYKIASQIYRDRLRILYEEVEDLSEEQRYPE